MIHFARVMVLAVCVLTGSVRLTADAAQSVPELRTENRLRDVSYIFHPQRSVARLQEVLDPLSLFSQTLAAAVLIGALMHRMRKDEAQLEHIASMLLKVAFIATVPLWKVWVLESAELMSEALGGPAVSGATLALESREVPEAGSELLGKLWAYGEQWSLEGSPVGDAMAGSWNAGEGRDEVRVGESWNWGKAPVMAAHGEAEIAWAAASNAERVSQVHRLILLNAGVIQGTLVMHYLMETLRLLLFHAGCAFAPFCIAALGTQTLAIPAGRALLGVFCVAFWPLAWAVGNLASSVMLDGALQVCAWTCSSAMYPWLADESQRTLAIAAPYLSWWLLGLMGIISLCLCLWMLTALIFGPWALHKLVVSGARRTGVV